MHIDKRFKLNKFELVRIPSPKQYFSRCGFRPAADATYSGDERIALYESKLQSVRAAMDEIASSFDEFRAQHEDATFGASADISE